MSATRPFDPEDYDPPALLEKLGTVAVEMCRAGLERAVVWALLGACAGALADLVSYLVAKRVADGSMPLGHSVMVLVTLGIPFATGAAFAFYGAQRGAIEAGFRHEREVSVLGWLVQRGLHATLAHLPGDVSRPTPAHVERAAQRATRDLLGQRRPGWTGPFGLLARIVHGTLTSVFARSLASALVESGARDATGEVRAETEARAHAALVASLREVFATVLALELAILSVTIFVAAIAWYPLCTWIVQIVPW